MQTPDLLLFMCFLLFHQTVFSQSDSLALHTLRSQLRCKYALDVAIKLDSSSKEEPGYHSRYGHIGIDTTHSLEPHFLEAFDFSGHWTLYKYTSFDAKTQFYLMEGSWHYPTRLFLISSDSRHAALLDRMSFDGGIESIQFDTINGGHVLRIEDGYQQSGWVISSLTLVAIMDGKLLSQFHCRDLEAIPVWKPPKRSLANITFIDLNNDGYRDILYELSEDLLVPNQGISFWDDKQLRTAKTLRNKSKIVEKYYWNSKSLTFEK
jgi:hypothetical protein